MSSLHEMFHNGTPLPIKLRAHAKYVDHGHLADSQGREATVYFVMLYGDNNQDDPVVRSTVEQMAERCGLSVKEVEGAIDGLVKKGMAMRSEDGKLMVLEPPDNFEFAQRMLRLEQIGVHEDDGDLPDPDEEFGGDSGE